MTQALEEHQGNALLFQQPMLRTPKKTTTRRTAAPTRNASPLMQLAPKPTPKPVENNTDTVSDVPAWARVPAIQLFISYIDRAGMRQRLHVVPHNELKAQDMELTASIKEILSGGGRNLVMDVIDVRIGACLSRWDVG